MLSADIKDFLKNVARSKFAKSTLILTVGTAISQFLPLIIYPILGRIYTPEEFGVLTALTSITNILVSVSTGKYELAVLVADSDKEAARITVLSIVISGLLLAAMLIPFYFFRKQIGVLCGCGDIGYLVLICPISAFFIVFFNCYNEWCVRKTYYKNLASNKITNSFAVTFGKLAFGFTKIKTIGLVIGDLLGRFLTALGCIIRVIIKDKDSFKSILIADLNKTAKKFIDFPKYTMPAQFLNTIGSSLPVLILGYYFNSKEIGYFGMTLSILSVPISVISLSVKDVFRQKANEIFIRDGHFEYLFKRIFRILLIVSVGGSLMVVFFLPSLFEIVLGGQWRISGMYAQIMLPMTILDFIAMSLSGVLIVTNKLKQNFYWQVYYTIISIVSLLIGCIWIRSITATLILFSLGRCSAYAYLLLISYRCSKKANVENC